ncbi:VOC family protein [Aminipila butyrica]|uniref:VOC family protein n=1 Tax=Aminipila butyrica TaxID=433296 RepID=A0A858BW04_9FIRM|nr:VOC family protein [Aminipila butyrica]QIB69602.1 VOC family protein [Aminipila butyrica]
MKWNWVTFQVNNLERSIQFYTEALKFEVASRFGSDDHQIVMLGKADEPKLELIWEKEKQLQGLGRGVSIGFEMDELDQLVQSLKGQGHSVEGPIAPNPHIRFFFVEDPDGYRIQLVEQKLSK